MDHDRLFKELLTNFFVEFIELFLPDVAAYLDPDSLEFLDKEVFTDVTAGQKRAVDLIVKARFQGQSTFFLVHVENQSKSQTHFPQRMFNYFARLHEKYNLPVYPVVLFSYDSPKKQAPQKYQVVFPDKTVLQFEYAAIQLNRLSWREYVSKPNPVASALMAKMKIAPEDRPKVRLECLRLLATLKLDPGRSQLIGGFIGTYLKLNAAEAKQYKEEFEKLAPEEKEAQMELMNPWVKEGWDLGLALGKQEGIAQGKQEGIAQGKQEGLAQGKQEGIAQGRQEGRQEGQQELLAYLINSRLGSLSARVQEQLGHLTSEELSALAAALFDFKTLAELEVWLSEHSPQ